MPLRLQVPATAGDVGPVIWYVWPGGRPQDIQKNITERMLALGHPCDLAPPISEILDSNTRHLMQASIPSSTSLAQKPPSVSDGP